jgi:hypothetical protein
MTVALKLQAIFPPASDLLRWFAVINLPTTSGYFMMLNLHFIRLLGDNLNTSIDIFNFQVSKVIRQSIGIQAE